MFVCRHVANMCSGPVCGPVQHLQRMRVLACNGEISVDIFDMIGSELSTRVSNLLSDLILFGCIVGPNSMKFFGPNTV